MASEDLWVVTWQTNVSREWIRSAAMPRDVALRMDHRMRESGTPTRGLSPATPEEVAATEAETFAVVVKTTPEATVTDHYISLPVATAFARRAANEGCPASVYRVVGGQRRELVVEFPPAAPDAATQRPGCE